MMMEWMDGLDLGLPGRKCSSALFVDDEAKEDLQGHIFCSFVVRVLRV